MTRLTVLRHGSGVLDVQGSDTVVTVDRLREALGGRGVFGSLVRFDEARILTHSIDVIGRPLKLGLLIRAVCRGACYVEDERGRRKGLSRSLLARWICQAAGEPFRKGALLRSIADQVSSLEQSTRVRRPHVLRLAASPVYLRTDISFGLRAGGSVAHTAGVLNHLADFTGPPVFITTDRMPGVREDIEVHAVRPSEAFWQYRELPSFVMNAEINRAAVRVLGDRDLSFFYQRYSVNNFAGASLAIRKGLPFVLEYNGSEVWINRHWGIPLEYEALSRRIELVDLAAADLVVVVSQAMADQIEGFGVPPARVLVNPNGVESDRYSPSVDGTAVRRQHGLEGKTVIGFIGTFGPWHGAEVLAEAFGRLMSRHPEYRSSVRLLMIGDGVRRPQVVAALEDSGSRDLAVLTGIVPQEDGPRYLAASDILASPHVPNADGTPFFGSPTKLFEYMAMGKGIVASDLDQIGEILGHGRAARMVEPGSVDSLVAGLQALIDDRELREALGAEARRLVIERHTWHGHVGRIIARLQELVPAA